MDIERKRQQRRELYARHRVRILALQKERYWSSPEERRIASEQGRSWRIRNAEKKRRDAAAYRAANAERIKAKKRVDYLRDRDKILAQHKASEAIPVYMREYRRIHRDELRAQTKAWHDRNRERMREASRVWRESHRDERTHAEGRRRARKRSNGGTHTFTEWVEKCELFAWCCAYCGRERPLTEDHKVPLLRGGRDDIANIAPACMSCNASKGTATVAEFLARRIA